MQDTEYLTLGALISLPVFLSLSKMSMLQGKPSSISDRFAMCRAPLGHLDHVPSESDWQVLAWIRSVMNILLHISLHDHLVPQSALHMDKVPRNLQKLSDIRHLFEHPGHNNLTSHHNCQDGTRTHSHCRQCTPLPW
jgi:hypothetical protein